MDTINTPLISIVIPTYNRAALLKRCLDSLCLQTYKKFEVLVCDDGSTDDSSLIVEKYKNDLNIKYLWEENWGGPARPRNRGISVAKGEWISFLDSDDWFYPNKLEKILKYVKNYDCIYHDLDAYDDNENKIRRLRSRQLKDNITKDLLLNGSLANSSVCVKTELLQRIDGFCEDEKLIAVEDFDCWLRLADTTSKFKYIPQSLGAYYFGENISISEKQNERLETVVYKHIHKLSKEDQTIASKTLYYCQAQTFHRLSMFKESRILYIKSISKVLFKRNLSVLIRYFLTLLKVVY